MAGPSVVSGTTVRFASLVAAILGTGAYAFSLLYLAVPAHVQAGVLTYLRCDEIRRREHPSPELDPTSYGAALEHVGRAVGECAAHYQRDQARWQLAGLALLLALAAVLFLAAPAWIRRRQRLVPLTAHDLPELHAALLELSTVAGLRRPPDFVLAPANLTAGGVTFGRFGRYTVRVNAGLVPLRRTDPEVFRAIVLHELAHIRNRDVDLGYLTMALWRSFVALALVPSVVVTLHPAILTRPWSRPWHAAGYAGFAATGLARSLLFVAVVYLCRNAVLRARELHADARAAQTGAAVGAGSGLRRTVQRGEVSGKRRWWLRLGVHPDPDRRRLAVADPTVVLRPGAGEMFAAGLTTIIAASTVGYLARLGLTGTGVAADQVVAWLVAPLAVGMLGAAAWRAEVLSSPERRVGVLGPALGFSLGWLLGDLLALNNATVDFGVFGSTGTRGRLPFAGAAEIGGFSLGAAVVAAVVLAGGMASQMAVSAAAARVWWPRWRALGPRLAWLVGVVVTMVPFALWYGIWSQVRTVPFLVGHLYASSTVDFSRVGVEVWDGPGLGPLTTIYPPLTLFMASAWAVPVVMLAWVYPLAPRPRWLGPAVVVGLAGGGVFAALFLALRLVLHAVTPTTGGAVYLHFAGIGLAVVTQAAVGVRLAATGPPLGVLLGQAGAFVTALVATVAMVATRQLSGCVAPLRLEPGGCGVRVDLSYTVDLLRAVVVPGALAALVAGVLARVVIAAGRRLPDRIRIRFRRPALRAAAVAGTVAALFAATVALASTRYANPTRVTGAGVSTPAPPASPSPSGSAGAGTGLSTGRPLTTVEARAAARAALVGLPSYWTESPPSPPSQSTVDPPECRPLANDTFDDAIQADRVATATVSLSNGGSQTPASLTITVDSYAHPVPASVFVIEDANLAVCPAFTISSGAGPLIRVRVTAVAPPALGEESRRTDLAVSTGPGGRTTAAQAGVVVRTGYTVISVILLDVDQPLEEALLLAVATRVVAALP